MSENKIKSYGLKKDDFISVSFDVVIPQTIKKTIIQKKEIESVVETIEDDLSIDDMFSEVFTKSIKKKKVKKVDAKRLQEIAKRVKKSKLNKVDSINKKINSIQNANINKVTKQSSSADEINEYLAKIQTIIYKNFNPPQNTQGKSAEVIIELSAIGKMLDFRILRPSDNEDFNKELYKIKSRLQGALFPSNPDNEIFRLKTIIISKE